MLSLIIHNLGELTVFRCAGRIIAGDGDALRHAVLTQPHMRVAVLDLAEITAVDAAGLGLLVSLWTWAHETGTELKLLNLSPRVKEVLELTNLKSVFEVCLVRDLMELMCRADDQGAFEVEAPESGSEAT